MTREEIDWLREELLVQVLKLHDFNECPPDDIDDEEDLREAHLERVAASLRAYVRAEVSVAVAKVRWASELPEYLDSIGLGESKGASDGE